MHASFFYFQWHMMPKSSDADKREGDEHVNTTLWTLNTTSSTLCRHCHNLRSWTAVATAAAAAAEATSPCVSSKQMHLREFTMNLMSTYVMFRICLDYDRTMFG